MRSVLGLACAALLACGHDAKPVAQPDPTQPVPSDTPIGYLIDDARELQLRDDQLSKLRDLNTELAAQLDLLDVPARGAKAAPSQGTGRHRGGGRRGRRGGGMASGAGSGSGSAAPQAPVAGTSSTAGDASRRAEERAADVRDAIGRALSVLDPDQQQIARRVLTGHGVDLDAGRGAARAPEPTEPVEPDPEAGSDDN